MARTAYKVKDIWFFYEPFDERDFSSKTVVVNCATRKPICIIDIPWDKIPHSRYFNKRVKRIVRKELEMNGKL